MVITRHEPELSQDSSGKATGPGAYPHDSFNPLHERWGQRETPRVLMVLPKPHWAPFCGRYLGWHSEGAGVLLIGRIGVPFSTNSSQTRPALAPVELPTAHSPCPPSAIRAAVAASIRPSSSAITLRRGSPGGIAGRNPRMMRPRLLRKLRRPP